MNRQFRREMLYANQPPMVCYYVFFGICIFAFGFHFGVENGKQKTINDFKKQLSSHKQFYEHNLRASK